MPSKRNSEKEKINNDRMAFAWAGSPIGRDGLFLFQFTRNESGEDASSPDIGLDGLGNLLGVGLGVRGRLGADISRGAWEKGVADVDFNLKSKPQLVSRERHAKKKKRGGAAREKRQDRSEVTET